MDSWNEQGGGGGYFNETGADTPSGEQKSKARQQFLCPVTVRQILEAPEDGLHVGNLSVTMVTIVGVVTSVNTSSTVVKFTLADGTGVIDCAEWIDSEETGEIKKTESLMEGHYYQIFGCIKSPHGQKSIMAFRVHPIEDFNRYTAFLAEVLSVNRYAQKMNVAGAVSMDTSVPAPAPSHTQLPFGGGSFHDAKPKLNPQQKEVLDAITAVEDQIGWNKLESPLTRKYTTQQIDAIIDYLVGEGYIYSTVDDDHFSHT